MGFKTVDFRPCPCGKRGFEDERQADRALGRAQAKRNRTADRHGTRRGIERERRYYECEFGTFHLTHKNREREAA
ncbi:hypothetical protein [Actinocorallia libanotica]|uniref:Uncharacterized protein n=1 Tax=Actinocorallia libanotica TaxID=46162 RepID=A0ABN1QR00_9ACTN